MPITVGVLPHLSSPLMRRSSIGSLLSIGPKIPTGSTSVPHKLPSGSIRRERISAITGLACRWRTLSAELLANRLNGRASILEQIGRSHLKDLR